MDESLKWRCHLPNLLHEMIEGHPSPGPLVGAARITQSILRELVETAAQLNDPKLNVLMLRLSLYDVPAGEVSARIAEQEARS